MKIKVCSKLEFIDIMKYNNLNSTNIEEIKNSIFIEINNTGDNSYFENNLDNVLILTFDDLTYEVSDYKLFDKNQALEIIKFVEKFKDRKNLFIRCSAGISRSGAVALWINDYLKQDYFEFKKDNNHIQPNNYIYNLLKKTYNEF